LENPGFKKDTASQGNLLILCIFVLFFEMKGSRCSGEPSISDVKGKNKYPKSELSSSRPKRRKTAVQYNESSDSEENEASELPQKMKGNMKWT